MINCESCARRRKVLKSFVKNAFKVNKIVHDTVKHGIKREYLDKMNSRFVKR